MHHNAITTLIERCGGDWVSTRWIDRLVLSRDASLYRMVPEAVARPKTLADVQTLLRACRTLGIHLTFRAAGTSLSGQAVTDGILVDLSRNWDGIEILDSGHRVRLQPGITGGRVNARLAPYGMKLGPDPASLNAAMIGGIVANNSSGMCCGTALNSYHTMESVRFVLADGTIVDTALPNADELLQRDAPVLHAQLLSIRQAVLNDQTLVELIRRKYQIKNTMGYSLNAFIDEDQPARILGRLMIGSEGTLGFIDEVIFRTVPDPQEKYTALFVYDSIAVACSHVPAWRDAGAAAVEIMDDASMRSFSTLPHTPEQYRVYEEGRAALLVEFHGQKPKLDGPWVSDPEERAAIWRLRKGLMPSVGAMRPTGTTLINEDIAVPPERLAELVVDVKVLFEQHSYDDAIIFGHAKDGNIHFVINQDFAKAGELERYAAFMDAVASIVADKHGGSLKAEHGTGRNMAPYVEQEWGAVATAIMRQVKNACDPDGVLNPDVLLSNDNQIHLKNIKHVPVIADEVNACIECGFCEHVCPTRSSTLTPRQRIILERELQGALPDNVRKTVSHDAEWMSNGSCAVDGICASACPVNINTGTWVKLQRSRNVSAPLGFSSSWLATRPKLVDTIARFGSVAARSLIPRWPRGLGTPDTYRSDNGQSSPDLVYIQACPSRWFGHGVTSAEPLSRSVLRVLESAGLTVHVVETGAACCGQMYDSKGLTRAADASLATTKAHLDGLGIEPTVPIMSDVSTCSAAFADQAGRLGRVVLSPLEAMERFILPTLGTDKSFDHVVVHPGCGIAASHELERMLRVTRAISNHVSVPASASCCGMAGDHGLRHRSLLETALEQEAADLSALPPADAYVSLNPLCQAGLAEQTSVQWHSLWEILVPATLSSTRAETPDSSR